MASTPMGGTFNRSVTVPAYTWANRPASASVGSIIRATDLNNALMMWNGTGWAPVGGGVVLACSGATGMTVTGTTSKTTLATVVVPGGMMGADGTIEVLAEYSFTGTAGGKRITYEVGGSIFFDNTASTSIVTKRAFTSLRNKGSVSTQSGPSIAVYSADNTGGIYSLAVNTENNFSIAFNVTLVNAADSATLLGYTVRLVR